MCCKNRQLTDHFPWQKEIAQGHVGASPGSFPAAVREVTELGNLLVFRSLPGTEYWWAAPRAWWQALPAAASHRVAQSHRTGSFWSFSDPSLYQFCRSYFALTPIHLKSESGPFSGVRISLHRYQTLLCWRGRVWDLLFKTPHKVQGNRKSHPQSLSSLNA